MSGVNDIAGLFGRVTALEQEGADSELTVTRITKVYSRLGLRVTVKTHLHQYRLCGDTNPIYPATCGTDTFL